MTDIQEILLINRDKDFLGQTADFLGQAGYTVHKEMDMRGALTSLSDHPVGLIICDKDLQDVSGYDFLNFLKKDPLRESIPFIFFVPVNDQGRPFRAFELGAIDFLVYPMDGQDLLKRTLEILPLEDSEAVTAPIEVSATGCHALQSSQVVSSTPQRRRTQRAYPLPSLDIDVSRDGVLWMPGRIKNFNAQGILVETALFGKSGVSLMIRFKLPEEKVIVMGRINHVSFNDFQAPAGIGIEIDQDTVWQKIYADLGRLKENGLAGVAPGYPQIPATTDAEPEETVLLPPQAPEIPGVYKSAMDTPPWDVQEPSYDDRFYDSLVGKQLDNYRIFTFIGCGSMGGVFQGWDVALEREVAMKVIACELSSQAAFRDMFIKEARTISRLDHPNIARIYYVGNSDDILYYAMEFIDGDTLADLIRRNQAINIQKGVEYLIAICRALAFVRKNDIIHRDIKPENIMVNNEGDVKLVDFGVAKIVDSKFTGKQPEAIMGSPLYMSPDCLAGGPVDYRSDIYSLGATFYHAFTGSPPFEGDNIQDILDQHQHHPLTPLKERNSRVPNVLGKIIEKMMAKDPRDRYQDYESVISAFKSMRFRALRLIGNRS